MDEQKNIFKHFESLGIPVVDDINGTKYIVDSFSKFDILISALHEQRYKDHPQMGEHFFYRGVTNENYKLRSSLRVNHLQMYEQELIQEMYNSSPLEFSNCKTDFEMIAKMQHYGLPTRFVDFTKNPYIALWFACQKSSIDDNSNGLIFCDDDAQYSDIPIRNIITKLILESPYKTPNDLFYKSFTTEEKLKYINELVFASGKIYFEPPKIDVREVNQQSVFLAECENIVEFTLENNERKSYNLSVNDLESIRKEHIEAFDESKDSYHFGFGGLIKLENFSQKPFKKIIISNKSKEEILQELSYRGITKSFIFPTLNNSAYDIKTKYQQMYPGVGDDDWD